MLWCLSIPSGKMAVILHMKFSWISWWFFVKHNQSKAYCLCKCFSDASCLLNTWPHRMDIPWAYKTLHTIMCMLCVIIRKTFTATKGSSLIKNLYNLSQTSTPAFIKMMTLWKMPLKGRSEHSGGQEQWQHQQKCSPSSDISTINAIYIAISFSPLNKTNNWHDYIISLFYHKIIYFHLQIFWAYIN